MRRQLGAVCVGACVCCLVREKGGKNRSDLNRNISVFAEQFFFTISGGMSFRQTDNSSLSILVEFRQICHILLLRFEI